MVYFAGDDLFAVNRPRGLPIGNLTSQFWANVYLNPLDHYIKRRLRFPLCPIAFGAIKIADLVRASGSEFGRLASHENAHPAKRARKASAGCSRLGQRLHK